MEKNLIADKILALINKIFNIIRQNPYTQKDLNQYFSMVGANANNQDELSRTFKTYMFERRLKQENKIKTIFDIFEESNIELTAEEKAILTAFKESINSIFEVKKVLRDGFEIFNLVNEETYKGFILGRMKEFKGVCSGDNLVGRILKIDNEYYIYQIHEYIPYKSREKALRFAIAKQMTEKNSIFKGNKEKLKEIKSFIKSTQKKFIKFFGEETIITTSKNVDSLIGAFNDYIENESPKLKADKLKQLIVIPETLEFFEVEEFTNNSGDILKIAAKGFGEQKKPYDVGILYDDNFGLLIVPFYKTFQQIIEDNSLATIKGAENCVRNFVVNSSIPMFVLKAEFDKNPDNFLNIVNKALNTEYKTFEEFEEKHKKDEADFSSTVILYTSRAFKNLMEFLSKEKKEIDKTVGRNDLCPCGSGLKYKKCCLKETV